MAYVKEESHWSAKRGGGCTRGVQRGCGYHLRFCCLRVRIKRTEEDNCYSVKRIRWLCVRGTFINFVPP
jgi:hypothetical protein